MAFERKSVARWHQEVPGARWLRMDIHVHTLDDHPSGNLRRPTGCAGNPSDAITRRSYSRSLLKAAIANGIEVLGLTPHSVRCGETAETSAVWDIVTCWNEENDDDDVPFRDKVYAVFPGFEPSVRDGSAGLHLGFLFDPEIGRDRFIRLFDAVMGGVAPYSGNSLQITTKSADDVFAEIETLHARDNSTGWNYLCVAPHAFSAKGLFKLQAQVLQNFPHDRVCAIELGDNKLPDDEFADRSWLKPAMQKHRHCFFHSSDAYDVARIGSPCTLVKLAQPRIEALRQAFLAPDARTRLMQQRSAQGTLVPRLDLPDPRALHRPWIRRIAVAGGTSFFTGADGGSQTIELSPDLTCIIGGRMSGKSTLLDGLRVLGDFELPSEQHVQKDVRARGANGFLSGHPTVTLDVVGPVAETRPLKERWPATFFTQRELQTAIADPAARRNLLSRLIADHAEELETIGPQIERLDAALVSQVSGIAAQRQAVEQARHRLEAARAARDAIESLQAAGVVELVEAQAEHGKLADLIGVCERHSETVAALHEEVVAVSVPICKNARIATLIERAPSLADLLAAVHQGSTALANSLAALIDSARICREQSEAIVAEARKEVQARIIAAGGDADRVNRVDALMDDAADFEEAAAEYWREHRAYWALLRQFWKDRLARSAYVARHRQLMESIASRIDARFGGAIRMVVRRSAVHRQLSKWILSLATQGVTRWWNSLAEEAKWIDPDLLYRAHRAGDRKRDLQALCNLGMTAAVANSFIAAVDEDRRLGLASLRDEDRYDIELNVGGATPMYREMGELSGGAQVSILISLLLEVSDSLPLVIDQPEDELDKAFLFTTVLPALRRLKGNRQVILSTHDANIVVNGDADQVVVLTADARRAHVMHCGAIDRPAIREAILETLDGGEEAFALRKQKYGF